MGERAPHHIHHLGWRGDRFSRFGNAAHLARGVVIGADLGGAARKSARYNQDRDRLAIGLRDAAVGVLGAGTMLHAEGAELLTRGHARDCVRHVQPDALLTHDDRADVERRGVFDQMIDRIGCEDVHALALHDFRYRCADFHMNNSLFTSPGWSAV
jgi:hypothetical protein